jgi:hypothetical protein
VALNNAMFHVAVIKLFSLHIDHNSKLLKPEYEELCFIFAFCAEREGFRSKIVAITINP